MTYAQAKMIVWNPAAYGFDPIRIISAAGLIMATLDAPQEDIDQAIHVLP